MKWQNKIEKANINSLTLIVNIVVSVDPLALYVYQEVSKGEIMALKNRKNSYDYEELLASSRGELFGEGFAQLPAPPMLMFDRITHIDAEGGEYGKGQICAELDLNPDLWFYQCHFIGDPVMPGCLGLDAMWQMIGFFLCWSGSPGKGRALGGEIKFTGQATNDKKLLQYQVDIKKHMKKPLPFGVGDAIMKADGEIIYRAKNLKVGLLPVE